MLARFIMDHHFVMYKNIKSLCCTPETNIILYIDYNSIKKTIWFFGLEEKLSTICWKPLKIEINNYILWGVTHLITIANFSTLKNHFGLVIYLLKCVSFSSLLCVLLRLFPLILKNKVLFFLTLWLTGNKGIFCHL